MTNHPNRKVLRPTEHLNSLSHMFPLAWKQLDDFRQSKGNDLPDWPEWCYCPLAGAYAVVSGGGGNTCNAETIGNVAKIGALAAWRTTQTIYSFDSTFLVALSDTEIKKLPVDTLFCLPQWCIYIEAPGLTWMDSAIQGFFAHLEHDSNTGRPEFRILWDLDQDGEKKLVAQQLHLNCETLGEAVESAVAESRKQLINIGKTRTASNMPEDLAVLLKKAVEPALSLVLYLCSDSPDLNGKIIERPKPKKTKKGWKLFPPDIPGIVETGYNVGAALRRAYLTEDINTSSGQGQEGRKTPRPHVRKAHWHPFWKGPMDGDRKIFIKWLPPIPINLNKLGDLPITVKKVNKKRRKV